MKVLLLGITGNVGSRLLPALLAHNHKLESVVVGSATGTAAIKTAILSHNCDAVVNAAGLPAMTGFGSPGDFPAIFAAVVQAVVTARRERGGAPIRCWLMSGFGILDGPKEPYLLVDYIPLYPSHRGNYELIKSHSPDTLAWSLLCANYIPAKYKKPQFPPPADASASNLLAKTDGPPAWTQKYRSIPLVGDYLNILVQVQSYGAILENCVDFIAGDLEKGLQSELIGKRVGIKEKSRVE